MPCLLTGCKSDSPNTGPAANAPCDHTTAACPHAVEIEINDTPATDDDLVQLKCSNPATTHTRHKVPCRIRLTGSATVDLNVVLTNPDGRLRFPDSGDTTKAVTLPAGGAWVSFEISGELPSNAIGDAKIEARANSAGGAVKTTKDVTVFWFDQAQMRLIQGGNYAFAGDQYTVSGAHAVSYESKARIRPSGVNCSAPQVTNLRVGIVQESRAYRHAVTWGNPTIAWNPTAPRGTRITVPRTQRLTVSYDPSVTLPVADSEASVAPLYDQPGKAGTLSNNSLQRPIGCQTGGASAPATSFDTPSHPAPARFSQTVMSGGVAVGTVTWTRVNSTRDEEFRAFCVVFDKTTNQFCVLREALWELHVDSAAAGAQHATVHSDAAPTSPPATGPSANDVPHTQSVAGVGAATATFTKP